MTTNFQQVANGPNLLKLSLQTYLKTFNKTIPISLCMLLLFTIMFYGPQHLPPQYQNKADLIGMFLIIAQFPLVGMLFVITAQSFHGQKDTYQSLLSFCLSRLLSLAGCLVSSSLLPLILILVGISAYIALLSASNVPMWALFLWPKVAAIFVMMAFVSKIFSFVLVFTEKFDTHQAIETSEAMVKGFFWRTFIYTLLVTTVLAFIVYLPAMAFYYFPVSLTLPTSLLDSIQALLLVLVAPWIAILWVCHQKDLYMRLNLKQSKKTKHGDLSEAAQRNISGQQS